MARYGRDFGRPRASGRGRYDMQYGNDRGYIARSRGFQRAPFGRGYDVDFGAADARARQIREEHRFQQERAAPGEELEWGWDRMFGGARGRGRTARRYGGGG